MRFVVFAARSVPVLLGLVVAAACFFDFPKTKIESTCDADFNARVLHSQTPVLVDFCATWCGPCRQLSPILEEIARETHRVKVVKMDVDQHRELAREFEVRGIPCLILIKDGQIQARSVGCQSKERIEAMLGL